MKVSEAKKAIKKAPKVFGFVKFSEDHSDYVQLVKADLMAILENMPADSEIMVTVEKYGVYLN